MRMGCAREGTFIDFKEHKERTMEVQFAVEVANSTDFSIHRFQTAQTNHFGSEFCRRMANSTALYILRICFELP